MNIAIDCASFGHNEAKEKKLSLSTSIFTVDVLDAFSGLGLADNFTLLVNYNHEVFFRERFPQYKLCVLKFLPLTIAHKLTRGKFKGTKWLKKLGVFSRAINKGSFDAVWFPYCVDYTYVKTATPSLCTVHDIYRVHRNGKAGWAFIEDQNCTLTTVSDYTKDDIIRTFALTEERASSIIKIPNSIVFDVSKQSQIPDLADKKYILDINAYVSKKNPMTLLKAYNLIKDKISESLVFCGGYKDDAVFKEMQDYICKNGLQSCVKMLFRVTDEERNYLLTHARLFVTPSLFEGFGRTPVEAAICGVPVISTKETSLYEATMGLCDYVDNAKDENELANLIIQKINENDNMKKLNCIAQTLKTNYEPSNLAKIYLKVIKEKVLKEKQNEK